MRQGLMLAKNLEAVVLGEGRQQKPFKYKMLGQLAAIGQRRGAAQVLGINFSGFFAWFLWRSAYLWKLPRLEKKIRVAFGWTIDLIFSRDLVQFMTVEEVERIVAFARRYQLSPQADKTDGQAPHKEAEAQPIAQH
jgi:NADH dehydrogenase